MWIRNMVYGHRKQDRYTFIPLDVQVIVTGPRRQEEAVKPVG